MYLKNGLIYLLAKLTPALSSFVLLAAYTRWMTTEEYGVLSTTMVVASSVCMFTFSWLYIGIMRFWESQQIDRAELGALISTSVIVISGIVGLFAVLFAIVTGQVEVAIVFWLLFVSVALFEAWQRINAITRQAGRYLWAELGRTLVTMLAGLLLVWLGYAWQGAAAAVILGMLLVLAVSGAWRYWSFPRQHNNLQVLKKLLVYGLPLSLSLALLEVVNTADRVMIGWLLGYGRAGEYAVAYNLPFQVLMMVTGSLNLAAYPFVIRALEQEGKPAAIRQLRQYFVILMAAAVPAVFGLLAVAELLIPLLIGTDFVAAALSLLPWISIAVFANCSYVFYVSLSFQLAEQTTGALKVAVLAALINVLLNLLLIPEYGLWGAVIASIAAYMVCLVAGFYLGRRHFALEVPWSDLAKVMLAAAAMYLFLQAMPSPGWGAVYQLVLKIIAGVTVYAALVWLLNIADVRQQLAVQLSLWRCRA
ncbi:MAG: lipopolysaccharide biosynthesis protein [Thiolinea sp.]